MSRNYTKISPRNEQRPRRGQHSSKSGYFVLLLLLIVAVTFYYVFSRGILFSNTQTPIIPSHAKDSTTPTAANPAKPRFEFYTLLSKETVPVPHDKTQTTQSTVSADATTSEIAQEKKSASDEANKKTDENEAVTQKTTQKESLPTESTNAPTGVPSVPVATTKHATISTAKKATPSTTPQPQASHSATTPISTPITTTSTTTPSLSTRYMLQVAALQRMSDVDQLKAKLSFMGFSASVEPFQNGGSTWYRVKVGPFLSQEALQKAKQTLMMNHLSAITITLPPSH